jgi:predicted Zn-dependent protease
VSRILTAIFIFASFGLLEAQQASVPSQPTPIGVPPSEGPGAAFQFTKADTNLRAEADDIDAQFESRGLVLHDPGVQAFVDTVGKRVLGDRPAPERVTYRFLVLCDPTVNSFALPNGSVYITTGLVALLENEAQLAGVLGHETAHIYERHPYLENRSIRKKTVASEIIAAAAAFVPAAMPLGWLRPPPPMSAHCS